MRSSAVTPHTGVWIETHRLVNNGTHAMSRPTRACGLKRLITLIKHCLHLSRPTRACGLKLIGSVNLLLMCSHAPHGRVD